jgi:hypothetical protein
VLGFNVGGERGRGVKDGRCVLPLEDLMLPHGGVPVTGGESGMDGRD